MHGSFFKKMGMQLVIFVNAIWCAPKILVHAPSLDQYDFDESAV
ncbi:hypothetical protein LNTAR_16888 [Lentisphaera araneosa HTCC2155]|uniref:Uncharacterized protein n=1 Tax=Lentisphaera araneosa HTCC2155 TaxID=313628 RepID=A6DF66_9BACT|nr:hypothetical protein LNTAR_16888 [Lentisphaera araneosa HTCC2155]